MTLRITSYGAARCVTGSTHLIEIDQARILIDFGMFQGPDVSELNELLEFDPRSLDAVLVTHGHFDHVGRLPLLIKKGYKGAIYTTEPTREICRLILLNSARVQADDYRRRRERIKKSEPVSRPMYTEDDVSKTLGLIEVVRQNKPFFIRGVKVRFGHAGHILGASFIELLGRTHRFVTSGDLGHWGPHVVPDPAMPPSHVDVLMIETTYGDTIHRPLSEATDELIEMIHQTNRQKGNLLIPTFSLARTQDVLHQLRLAYDKHRIPPKTKVYLDSPLGIRFTELYRHYPELLTPSVKNYILRRQSPFSWDNVEFTFSSRKSHDIQRRSSGTVIMASSGMATGGRILNHLKKNLQRPESAVAFVGFQAEGTLGRELLDGAKEVEIDGEPYEVKAHITKIDGFSVHADQLDIVRWVLAAGKPHVLLIHGEEEAPGAVQKVLHEEHHITSTIVERSQTYEF